MEGNWDRHLACGVSQFPNGLKRYIEAERWA
jgi:hypothetical protein